MAQAVVSPDQTLLGLLQPAHDLLATLEAKVAISLALARLFDAHQNAYAVYLQAHAIILCSQQGPDPAKQQQLSVLLYCLRRKGKINFAKVA